MSRSTFPLRRWRWASLAALPLLTPAAVPAALAQTGWRQPAAPPPVLPSERPDRATREGGGLVINGRPQQARWRTSPSEGGRAAQLWLPLEVLQGQLGVTSRSRPDGSLELEWFGNTLRIPASGQISLEDEVAVEAAPLLGAAGVRWQAGPASLVLEVPQPSLVGVRVSNPGGGRRVVFDLDGAAALRQEGAQLLLGLRATAAQRAELQGLGLSVRQSGGDLLIDVPAGASRVLTLGGPARVVLDLAAGGGGPATGTATRPTDPRLQALLNGSVSLDRQVRTAGSRRVVINSARIDPSRSPLELRPLFRPDGMEGLSSLPLLARREQALVAINGGFFNRVRRLPLGALKDQGRWLSGPILNRGAVGWQPGGLPRFGRLALEEWVSDESGRRWPVTVVNSGYVQRGLARYTAEWGRGYRALSGGERGLLLRGGLAVFQLTTAQLEQGIGLAPEDILLIGRAGVTPPWPVGTRLQVLSRPSDPLGELPFVMGGGPLLLQGGQLALNGTAEGFSAAFQQQGAPRTVIGSDGRQLWLITLEGVEDSGPTLRETAVVLQQLGLRDALNLDGGSSTGLMVGGTLTVRGRGVSAAIHNGLGLIPRGIRALGDGGAETEAATGLPDS